MWRSKKFIVIALLAVVVLVGSIGGIVFAQTENGDDSQPEARYGALLEKVCEIYNANPDRPSDIDCDVLKDAFAQAQTTMRPEGMPNRGELDPEAMQETMLERLEALLADGKISKEQFNKMQERFDEMKTRMESMPDDLPRFGFRGHGFPRFFGPPCEPAE